MTSAAEENGASVGSATLPAENGESPFPPPPLSPPPPQRICFAHNKVVGTGFSTAAMIPEPICGQTLREMPKDAVTFDKEMVNCAQCQAILAGRTETTPAEHQPQGTQPGVGPAAPPTPALGAGSLQALLEQLDVEKLTARQRELEGELAAVKVLLSAAEARERARGK